MQGRIKGAGIPWTFKGSVWPLGWEEIARLELDAIWGGWKPWPMMPFRSLVDWRVGRLFPGDAFAFACLQGHLPHRAVLKRIPAEVFLPLDTEVVSGSSGREVIVGTQAHQRLVCLALQPWAPWAVVVSITILFHCFYSSKEGESNSLRAEALNPHSVLFCLGFLFCF